MSLTTFLYPFQKSFPFKFLIKVSVISHICSRGKMQLGYSDADLTNMGGYEKVHHDDLAYVASAHQERKY